MTVVLWVLFGLAGVSWAGLGLLFAYLWVARPSGDAKNMALSLAVLLMFLLAVPLSLPGGVAGVWLAARLDTPDIGAIVGIAGGIMLAVVALVALGLWSEVRQSRFRWQDGAGGGGRMSQGCPSRR
jgi:ABC-type Mn2+/Zn2+ transport system permease subunit